MTDKATFTMSCLVKPYGQDKWHKHTETRIVSLGVDILDPHFWFGNEFRGTVDNYSVVKVEGK